MQVTCVDGAQAALGEFDAVKNQPDSQYALALVDFQIPEMNGIELGALIRDQPQHANLKLVLFTSVAMRGQFQEAETAGFAAYIPKPIRREQLYPCLLATVRHAGSAKSAPIITRHQVSELEKRGRARVLLAEDNVINQKVAVRRLEKLGYRVDAFTDGMQAVNATATEDYDIVLMDRQMPVMDGFEATQAIRNAQDSNARRLSIVALTANAMAGDKEACLGAGMDDYLSKPIKRTELAEALERWIQFEVPPPAESTPETAVA